MLAARLHSTRRARPRRRVRNWSPRRPGRRAAAALDPGRCPGTVTGTSDCHRLAGTEAVIAGTRDTEAAAATAGLCGKNTE